MNTEPKTTKEEPYPDKYGNVKKIGTYQKLTAFAEPFGFDMTNPLDKDKKICYHKEPQK